MFGKIVSELICSGFFCFFFFCFVFVFFWTAIINSMIATFCHHEMCYYHKAEIILGGGSDGGVAATFLSQPCFTVKVFVSWLINPLILLAGNQSHKAIFEYSLCKIKVFGFGNSFPSWAPSRARYFSVLLFTMHLDYALFLKYFCNTFLYFCHLKRLWCHWSVIKLQVRNRC